MAQVDYFLKIAGVDAESTDDKHKGEIEVDSFSWGQTQTGSAGHGGGGGAGKVVAQDFHFVKRMDKSSPVLFIACATGMHYKTAVLTARKAGSGAQQEYLKVTMEDVLISSYQTGGSGSGIIPTEQVSLNFAKIEFAYKEQKPDGSLGGEVKQKYDYAANKKI